MNNWLLFCYRSKISTASIVSMCRNTVTQCLNISSRIGSAFTPLHAVRNCIYTLRVLATFNYIRLIYIYMHNVTKYIIITIQPHLFCKSMLQTVHHTLLTWWPLLVSKARALLRKLSTSWKFNKPLTIMCKQT